MAVRIEAGCLVSLEVAMYDAQGHLLERSQQPLVYLHGANDIFAGIEQALEGRSAGERLAVTLEPDQAFGDADEMLVHLVDCRQLGDKVELGMRYEGLPGKDDGRIYTVTDIAEGMAVLDGNHPLAGWTLRFDLHVLGVERAGEAALETAQRPQPPEFIRALAPHDLHREDTGEQ